MGVLGGDNAGFPNGRRLADDVVDIEEQAVAGFLKGKKVPLGDGVNAQRRGEPRPLPLRRSPAPGLREREGDEVGANASGGPLRRAPCSFHPPCATASSSSSQSSPAAAIGALYGGVFRDRTSRRLRRARRRAGGRGLQGRLLAEREHGLARRRPPVAPRARTRRTSTRTRCSGSPTSSGRARPATRPSTRSPRACCAARSPSTRRTPSPSAGSARSRSPATASATPSRSASRRATLNPVLGPHVRRDRRRARRARPLPRGVPRLRHDEQAPARASPRTRASRTAAS